MVEPTPLLKSIDDLIIYWKQSKIPVTGLKKNRIDLIINENEIILPSDFRSLYSRVNGMGSFYPNDSDENGFLFYPLENVLSASKEFTKTNLTQTNQVYLFMHYLHRSWWYGVKVLDESNYEIGIIPTSDLFTPITNSLSKFIDLYLKDGVELYEI